MLRKRPNKPRRFQPPEVCPLCGHEPPPGALACPQCGADEHTGWSEAARYDSLDLPDEEFDYDAFVAEEFGGGRPPTRRQKFWWIVGLAVLLVFVWCFVLLRF